MAKKTFVVYVLNRDPPVPFLSLSLFLFFFLLFFFLFFSFRCSFEILGVVAKSVSISVNAIAHCDSFQWFQIGKSVLDDAERVRSGRDLHACFGCWLNFQGKYILKAFRDLINISSLRNKDRGKRCVFVPLSNIL